jgi:hypothetical protein
MTDFITPEWIKKRKEQADKQEVEARIANTADSGEADH